MYFTWLDSNSWLIEIGEKRILLDPWLVGSLTFSNQAWLFKGDRPTPHSIPQNIDLILLSQGLEDHTHPLTLQHLDPSIPVVASPSAAKVVRQLGYTHVTALSPGEVYVFAERVTIQATSGAPIGPFVTENGYLLTERDSRKTVYYEPHGYHPAELKQSVTVDVVIAPILDLSIPLLGPIIQGRNSAPKLLQSLRPQIILPTAAGGDVNFTGMLMSMLQTKGSADELRQFIAANQLPTQVIELKPGDRFQFDAAMTPSKEPFQA